MRCEAVLVQAKACANTVTREHRNDAPAFLILRSCSDFIASFYRSIPMECLTLISFHELF